MRTPKLIILALALAGAQATRATDPAADTAKELAAMKARITELEKAQQAAAQAAPAPAGMTPEQLQDLGRITVKAEGLEDSRDASGLKGFKISGYMDPTYVWNANKERGTFQFLVPASAEGYGYDNSYFGTVSLDVQKETENGTKFHLNLIPKRGTGDFNDGSIVNEATVWIPLGGLDKKLFAGQIPDWSGYEYQAPTQNLLVTHNLLFDFTLPFFYTGVGLELVKPRLDLKLMLANFNSSIRQVGEHVPAFVFRGDYTPKGTDYWGLGFAGGLGYKSNLRPFAADGSVANNPVTGDPYSTKDTLFVTGEVDGWYTRGAVTFNAHVNFGSQQQAAITAGADGKLRDAQWFGVSALAAYKWSPKLQGILRGDFIYDQKNGGGLLDWTAADGGNGVGPDQKGGDANKGANKYALTAGLGYTLSANVTLKAEVRFDGATQNVFANKDALTGGPSPKYSKTNALAATQVVFFF